MGDVKIRFDEGIVVLNEGLGIVKVVYSGVGGEQTMMLGNSGTGHFSDLKTVRVDGVEIIVH